MKLVFATSNANKIAEIRPICPSYVEIVTLEQVGITEEIPETSDTVEGNSLQKAKYVFDKTGYACFAEDTGLFIESLNGEPGVYSARYAGNGCSYNDNVDKVLHHMTGKDNRKAYFKTVITYYHSNGYVQFEGITNGQITNQPVGNKGFGYDPVFIPEGSHKTYAEMDLEEKNNYSHRKKSFILFANHLQRIGV